jgi:hypothetical protein
VFATSVAARTVLVLREAAGGAASAWGYNGGGDLLPRPVVARATTAPGIFDHSCRAAAVAANGGGHFYNLDVCALQGGRRGSWRWRLLQTVAAVATIWAAACCEDAGEAISEARTAVPRASARRCCHSGAPVQLTPAEGSASVHGGAWGPSVDVLFGKQNSCVCGSAACSPDLTIANIRIQRLVTRGSGI